jgi:hypothetical protein
MISQLEGLTSWSGNGKPMMRTGEKSPERSPCELLAWAILEQAVDDLVLFCRYGLISPEGQCRPWPFAMRERFKRGKNGWQKYLHKARANVAACTGPYQHRELRAWFLSEQAQTFCDLIGCNLPPGEIFFSTVKNHAGGKR